jgi:UvrD/REP helicase N-terminal domain
MDGLLPVLRTKQESLLNSGRPDPTDWLPMSIAYLEKLNPEQRRAVEHGVGHGETMPSAPLLVIAGAGSGKTDTLAHRVAHLVVNGLDPRRVLLMTFSRRAAAEITRRAGRICAQVSVLARLHGSGSGLSNHSKYLSPLGFLWSC